MKVRYCSELIREDDEQNRAEQTVYNRASNDLKRNKATGNFRFIRRKRATDPGSRFFKAWLQCSIDLIKKSSSVTEIRESAGGTVGTIVGTLFAGKTLATRDPVSSGTLTELELRLFRLRSRPASLLMHISLDNCKYAIENSGARFRDELFYRPFHGGGDIRFCAKEPAR